MSTSPRRPKLAHVAMHAGVSLGTASDALRGKGRMSDETRRRVIATAEAMGYRPSAQARALATGHSQIVALVVQDHDTAAAPRIYWPKLQAEFTEQLLARGFVACTMTLQDLAQLDGLPFDLIVFAHLRVGDDVPAEIRRNYRVVDIDFTGDSRSAADLRSQFERLCSWTLDNLADRGAEHPALILPPGADAQHPAAATYRKWCADRSVADVVLISQSDRLAEVPESVDGLFSILLDPDWLVDQLVGQGREAHALPIIALGAEPQGALAQRSVARLTLDGEALGMQLAEIATAVIAGQPAHPLRLTWLLGTERFSD
jgi:DNA-binding LacI/PurR family transcriptional regulator